VFLSELARLVGIERPVEELARVGGHEP